MQVWRLGMQQNRVSSWAAAQLEDGVCLAGGYSWFIDQCNLMHPLQLHSINGIFVTCQVATSFEQSAFPGSPPTSTGATDAPALGEVPTWLRSP